MPDWLKNIFSIFSKRTPPTADAPLVVAVDRGVVSPPEPLRRTGYQESVGKLVGVHPDLVRVIERASTIQIPGGPVTMDFIVTEGLRTLARQKELVAAGASRTLNSRHLTGHAVDLAARINGEVRWDWPLYRQLAVQVKAAAAEVGVPIEWGGDWKTLKDGPHFQLPVDRYPAS